MNDILEKKVKEYLDVYFLKRDLKSTLEYFATNPSVIGTGLDEVGFSEKLADLYQRDMEQAPNPVYFDIKTLKIQIINQSTALAIAVLDLQTNIQEQLLKLNNIRATILFVCVDNQWLIQHKHISLPTLEHGVDESYPLKELEERKIVLERKVEQKTQELNRQIKELKLAQESLQEINKEKDKFFSIVAHDIKSPFNTLLSFTDLLANNDLEIDQVKLNQIHKNLYLSTKKTHSLLENLLEWAGTQMKKSHLQIRDVSAHSVAEDVSLLFKEKALEKNIQIFNETDKGLLCVADENILTLVLRNLISNAIKFSHQRGKIKISTRFMPNHLNNNEGKAIILISDDGVGMSPEKVNSLFRVESSSSTLGTNNESGNGLGLIFTKDMVECLGGQISIWSEPLKGTKISVQLSAKKRFHYQD